METYDRADKRQEKAMKYKIGKISAARTVARRFENHSDTRMQCEHLLVLNTLFSVTITGKQHKMAQVFALSPIWKTWIELQVPGFNLAQPWLW